MLNPSPRWSRISDPKGRIIAVRDDGVALTLTIADAERPRWFAHAPLFWGDGVPEPRQLAALDAVTLLDAAVEVDARFPLAAWWPANADDGTGKE